MRLVAAAAGSLALIGCAAPQTTASAPVGIAEDEYPRIFHAAVNVLRDEGFMIDQQDYRFGTVSTKPTDAATLGEPWRGRGQTAQQAAGSTVNDQRRIVTVSITPADKAEEGEDVPADADFLVRVEAVTEQLQVTTRYLTGSTRGKAIFGHYNRVPAELEERGIGKWYWMPVGRDPYLEERLLRRIVRDSVNSEVPPQAPVNETPAE